MQEIAARAGEFLHGSELEEAFHYFSPANLKGAAISIAIGAAVYLLVVRKFLRSGQGEEIRYPNRWPAKLDLEELVYRPLLRALSFFGAVCARLAASAGDFIVFLGGKLLFLRAPGIFVPKRNENFGAYGKKPESFLVKETFSFNLMLSGLGLIVMLLYVLLR
jgi:hydrogenase-4 component B